MDVDKTAVFCPICNFEFPRRNPIYAWVAVLLAIFLLILFIF
ncbi:hypothetical protein Belba_2678 [Belliella baltica DSM 15883]|uniref:Uncharacterized protein n=1 Tax=Belliella baltica (strain DSM 15883 / CIP 108006 / LMG 21964 / BA134) TaxID=866536 RepID=I3Z7K4_BELBD|nr:hypothetical protein Belba_2678 [Belliella baltica DSM 15883]